MIIIGITGTIGAGKGTIVDYLIENYGFQHFSVRQFLAEEAERRKLPLNRDSYVAVANDLRAKYVPSYIVDQLCIKAIEKGENAIIESIRTPGEITSLRKYDNFYLLAVDAKPEIRYRRIVERNSETDKISYTTFLENEQREMNSTDPNKQNLSHCIAQADFMLYNNGNLDELYNTLQPQINKIESLSK